MVSSVVLATVEMTGRLYEKHGVKYIDMTSVKATVPDEDDEWEEEDPGSDDPD